MREIGRYCTETQMFVEKPRELDVNHLRFMRFRIERGDFGRQPLSVPRGDALFKLSDVEIRKYAMQQADQEPSFDQKMKQHIAANGE